MFVLVVALYTNYIENYVIVSGVSGKSIAKIEFSQSIASSWNQLLILFYYDRPLSVVVITMPRGKNNTKITVLASGIITSMNFLLGS